MCQIKLKKNELPGDDFLNDSIYISYFLSMISFPYSIPVEYNYNLIFIDSTYVKVNIPLICKKCIFIIISTIKIFLSCIGFMSRFIMT